MTPEENKRDWSDPEQRRAYNREYQREYRKRRYREDPEFRQKCVETQRQRRKKDPQEHRRYDVKSRYGLTIEEYRERTSRPCAICGVFQPEVDGRPMHIDHDHKTGIIRDTLCPECNHGIGKFGDDPERVRQAAIYLYSHAQKHSA